MYQSGSGDCQRIGLYKAPKQVIHDISFSAVSDREAFQYWANVARHLNHALYNALAYQLTGRAGSLRGLFTKAIKHSTCPASGTLMELGHLLA